VHPARQRKKYCSFLTGRIDQREEILKLTEDNEKFTTGDGQTNVTDLATYGRTTSANLAPATAPWINLAPAVFAAANPAPVAAPWTNSAPAVTPSAARLANLALSANLAPVGRLHQQIRRSICSIGSFEQQKQTTTNRMKLGDRLT
jgi:hypothetical protein